jgi:hypothetical protein
LFDADSSQANLEDSSKLDIHVSHLGERAADKFCQLVLQSLGDGSLSYWNVGGRLRATILRGQVTEQSSPCALAAKRQFH